jgi:hypothetical protein
MFDVIISTIRTGRVQRKSFASAEKARRCFARFDDARSRTGERIYRVDLPAPATLPGLSEAA